MSLLCKCVYVCERERLDIGSGMAWGRDWLRCAQSGLVCVCWHDVCVNQGAWLRQTGLAGWRGTPHHRSLAWRDRREPWIHIHTHRFSGRAPSGTGSFLTDTHTVSIHLSSAGHSQGGVCTTLTRMKDTCYCCVNDSITHRINIRINIKSTWLKYCTKSIITFPSVLPKLLCPTLKMESAVGGNSIPGRHNTLLWFLLQIEVHRAACYNKLHVQLCQRGSNSFHCLK